MNCQITRRMLLAAVAMAMMTLYVQACPYHDRLRELARQQRERMAELRRQQRLHDARQSAIHRVREDLGSSHRTHNHASHGHRTVPRPAPRPAPVAGGSRRITHVRRPVSTGSSHRYYPQTEVNGHTNYVGSYVVQPDQHVPCPGSNIYYCPIGTYCKYERGRETPYRCMYRKTVYSCNTGFIRVNITSTRFRCEDVNECDSATLNTCDQECINTHGSFRCRCRQGFVPQLDGISCEDLDECSRNYCQYQCTNFPGSYNCSCPEGYTYNEHTHICSDIDECQRQDICDDGERCLNLNGGYECYRPIPCDEGYRRSPGQDFGPCLIIDYDPYNYAVPVSISKNRYGLRSEYAAGSTVGKLNFGYPLNDYTIIEGEEFFKVHTTNWNRLMHISTKVQLEGAGKVYEFKVEVVNRRQTTPVKSRFDFEFVLSEYNF